MRRYEEAHSRRPHWEVVIHPFVTPKKPLRPNLSGCFSTVQACQLHSKHGHHPQITSNRRPGPDWIGSNYLVDGFIEMWRLSQFGVFAHMLPITDLRYVPHTSRYIDTDELVYTISQGFRFAAKLTEEMLAKCRNVVVGFRIVGTNGLPLMMKHYSGPIQCGLASEPELAQSWTCSHAGLKKSNELAIVASLWFFERFNWTAANEENVSAIFNRVFGADAS
jgi:hypothetical protein